MSTPEANQKDGALDDILIASVSLAAGIAANHPAMGQCQIERLRSYGVSEQKLALVVEIARHIRDEAAEKLDFAFDEKTGMVTAEETPADDTTCGCAPTPSGQRCC